MEKREQEVSIDAVTNAIFENTTAINNYIVTSRREIIGLNEKVVALEKELSELKAKKEEK